MANFKKVLLVGASFVLVAALSIGGTMAYLTDNDSDVNVMTLGNVEIAQLEYQRADGVAHNAGEAGAGNGVKEGDLVPYVQGQPLYPAVPKNGAATDYTAEASDLFFWGDYVYSGTAGNGLWNDEKLSNVMDKMIFVENTGKTDAYVRTLIAFECPEGMEYGEGPDKEFMMNVNGGSLYAWKDIGYIKLDGVRYCVTEATYQKALSAGNTSHPSLLQVVMTHNATNEDMELLGGSYEILAVSQAVQTAGFKDAKTALDTAFGESTEAKATEWFGGNVTYASNLNDVEEAFAEGGTVILADDIALDDILYVENGADVRLNMNGKTFTASGKMDPEGGFIWVKDGSSLTIEGNGTFDLGANPGLSFIVPQGEVVIENGTFIRNVPAGTDPSDVGAMFVGTKTGSLVINGGYFDGGYYDKNANGIEEILEGTATLTETANDMAKRGQSGDANIVRVALKNNVSKNLNMSAANVKVYGGTFVGVNPAWGDEGCMLPTTPNYLRPWSYYQGAFLDGQTFNENGIVLPDGYTITVGATEDDRPTYTVKYSK